MRLVSGCSIALITVLAMRADGDAKNKNDVPFWTRYKALEAARRLYQEAKTANEKNNSLAAVATYLEIPEMADFAVEDLRKWKRWEYCETIVKLQTQRGFDGNPFLRRSIVRYALQCPTQQALNFVKAERMRDAEFVADAEELLALEVEPAKQ